MVIVVPTLAKGEQSDPPTVGRAVTSDMTAIAKIVADAVDKAGGVKPDKQPRKNAPDQKRHPTPGVE